MNFSRLVSILLFMGFHGCSMAGILFYTDFVLPDGPVIETTDALWKHHSGSTGDMRIENNQVHLSGGQTEDVHALLMDGPWTGDKTSCLYARFSMRCAEAPTKSGGCFLHFMDSKNGHRCRIFTTSEEAEDGFYRLGISNGGTAPDALSPFDLPLNVKTTVVVRYGLADARGAFWLNPSSENDACITAQDAATAGAITSLALRQAAGIGSIWIDDLTVGTQFSDVVSSVPSAIPFLTRQPQNVSVAEGESAEFSVTAESMDPVAFQWIWNGTGITGETNAALRMASVSKAQEGAYWVVVSNTAGSAQSQKAMLTITNAGQTETPFIFEKFDYGDGPLCAVSSGAWRRHSGATNEVLVAGGSLLLSELASEDVNRAIPGAPLTNTPCLYAGFTIAATALPSGTEGGYFAHFKDGGNGFRCRIFAIAQGAGCWRLGIASTNNRATASLGEDIPLGQSCRVVAKLDQASGASWLWINPRDENSPCATAPDSGRANASAFAFRQSLSGGMGMGVLRVDDLCVGPSMRSVLLDSSESAAPLVSIVRAPGEGVHLRWSADPARTYTVWQSSGLELPFSIKLKNAAFPDGIGIFFEESSGSHAAGFYRISTP